ncbi:zinc finger, CCHC-type containing protein [Tanacetum coccineum]|uniref:Zinc finger, CCHC-type containing protein n=1 Tax=Tanacetum coccineum TaxID=301880 RepID=A0ABQ5G017_9ASTR
MLVAYLNGQNPYRNSPAQAQMPVVPIIRHQIDMEICNRGEVCDIIIQREIFHNLYLLISLTKSSIILHQLVEFFNDDFSPFASFFYLFCLIKSRIATAIQVSCIIDKLPPSWKDFKYTLKHLKEKLTLVELGNHQRIEEFLRVQDSDKPKGNNVAGPSFVNMVDHNNSSRMMMSCGGLTQEQQFMCVKINVGSRPMSRLMMDLFFTWKMSQQPWCMDVVVLGHVHFKRMQDMSKDGLIPTFDMDTEKFDLCDLHATPSLGNKNYFVTFIDDASRTDSRVLGAVVRLPDPKLKTLGEKGIECIFIGYVEHSKAFRFYVIEPNDSVSINSIIESMDAIFDENRFSSVPRPSFRIPNRTEDIGGSVVPEEVTEEVVQQPELELRKGKRNRTPKNFGLEFQLYLIEGTKNEDVTFWKEAINDKMDSIMGNNTWVLADLPPGCKPLGCKWIFKRKLKVDGNIEKFKERLVIQGFKQKSGINYFDTYATVERLSTIRLLIAMTSIYNLIIHPMDVKTAFLNGDLDEEVDLTKEFLSSRFFMKNMGEADVIQVSTPMDTSKKLMPNNGQAVSQLEYSRVIGYLMYAMTCTRLDIAFVVGKLSRYTSNPVLEGYTDARWISNTKENSSTSGWVFLLGGDAISWASKKQTCIISSTMESEFVALAAASKETEWLRNLILEIPLWSKPITPISICCDSAATLSKAYSHMYNGKSRHLGVRHNMIRELITNGVISIEFVRSQQNLAAHLTKGLARDLVINSAEGMGLKSN